MQLDVRLQLLDANFWTQAMFEGLIRRGLLTIAALFGIAFISAGPCRAQTPDTAKYQRRGAP
jgi:hypothetical protein